MALTGGYDAFGNFIPIDPDSAPYTPPSPPPADTTTAAPADTTTAPTDPYSAPLPVYSPSPSTPSTSNTGITGTGGGDTGLSTNLYNPGGATSPTPVSAPAPFSAQPTAGTASTPTTTSTAVTRQAVLQQMGTTAPPSPLSTVSGTGLSAGGAGGFTGTLGRSAANIGSVPQARPGAYRGAERGFTQYLAGAPNLTPRIGGSESGFFSPGTSPDVRNLVSRYNAQTGGDARFVGGRGNDLVDFGDGRGPVSVRTGQGLLWYNPGKRPNQAPNAGAVAPPGGGLVGRSPGEFYGGLTGAGPFGGGGAYPSSAQAAGGGITPEAEQDAYRKMMLAAMGQGNTPY